MTAQGKGNSSALVGRDIIRVPLRHSSSIYTRYGVKRSADVLLSAVGLVATIAPMAVIAILVKATSRGPAIFKQKRLGRDGKTFTIYKFRTMHDGAEEKLEKMLATDKKLRAEYATNKKIHNDPRITRVGKILRETSLDELPQLVNIFLGHMSIVGPRPYLVSELKDIGDHQQYILALRPGLTGAWQTSGRSELTFNQRLALDKHYHENLSHRHDLVIILKTIVVVFKKVGAK